MFLGAETSVAIVFEWKFFVGIMAIETIFQIVHQMVNTVCEIKKRT